MNTYVVFDQLTGEVLHFAVCPGPFQVNEDFIEALVEMGNVDRVRFMKVDPRDGIPRVVNPHAAAEVAAQAAPSLPQGPVDFERIA